MAQVAFKPRLLFDKADSGWYVFNYFDEEGRLIEFGCRKLMFWLGPGQEKGDHRVWFKPIVFPEA